MIKVINENSKTSKIKTTFNKFADFIEKHYIVFFILILLLAFFINIYKLGKVPHGIHIDEAGMTYDAYSIANYGVDRFLKHFPVYFINFGGGQNALYTYLTAIIIKIVGGYDSFIIRLPALILSMIEVAVSFLLIKEFKSKKQALLFMLLVTISPWHIMKSRWGLESYLLSPMLLFSIYSLVKAIKNKKIYTFIISGIIFGLTLYTYALSYIVIPLFLLLTLIYLLRSKEIKLKHIIAFIVPLIFLAMPLILMLMVQKGWIEEIDSFITIPKMLVNRLGEINISNFKYNIQTIQYIFLKPSLNYNGIHGYGTLYIIGVILMCIGLIVVIVNKIRDKLTKKTTLTLDKKEINLSNIMMFAFFSNLILCTLTNMNINKANGIYISSTFFILVAIEWIYKYSKVAFTTIIFSYIFLFLMFINKYFTDFAKIDYSFFDNGNVEVLQYVNNNSKYAGKQIYSDIEYIYNLYGNPISPYEFYENIKFYNILNEKDEIDGKEVKGYNNYLNDIDYNNLDDNAIYVVHSERKSELIQANGFKLEKYNKFYILYK